MEMNESTIKSADGNSLDHVLRSPKKMLMKNAFAESSINTRTKLTIRKPGDDPSRTYSMISDSSNTNDSRAENSQKFNGRENYVTASCPQCGTKITMVMPMEKINIQAPENSAIINSSENNSFVAEKPLTCCSSRESSLTESPRTPNTVNKKPSLMKSSRASTRLINSPRRTSVKKSVVKNTLSPSYKLAETARSPIGNINVASGSLTSTPRNSIPYCRPITPRISEIRADEIGQYNESTADSSSAFQSPLSGINSFSRTYSIEKLETPSPVKLRNKKQETKIPVPKKGSRIEQVQQGKFEKTDKPAIARKQQSAATDQIATNSIAATSKRRRLSAETAIRTAAVNGGVYNRYGYRVRKHEARMMISRKLPTQTSDKRTKNRILQQRARVDRRFNASMERRNKRWI